MLNPVPRCLDKPVSFYGYEVPDIIFIFVCLAILHLLFRGHSWEFLLVWVPTLIIAGVLRWAKRGKPEFYLVHWIRFHVNPGIYSAFSQDKD